MSPTLRRKAESEHLNLTKAAAALNVTHSAISQQIRGLERRLGAKLIIRNQHGISLTSQGEYLSAGLLEAFAAMATLTENLSDAEATRPLLVSATPMFASAFLMPRVADFMDDNPNNVDAARKSGINGVCVDGIDEVRRALLEVGAIDG